MGALKVQTAPGVWTVIGGQAAGGLDQATADDLYVNIAGDTMTGALIAPAVTLQNATPDLWFRDPANVLMGSIQAFVTGVKFSSDITGRIFFTGVGGPTLLDINQTFIQPMVDLLFVGNVQLRSETSGGLNLGSQKWSAAELAVKSSTDIKFYPGGMNTPALHVGEFGIYPYKNVTMQTGAVLTLAADPAAALAAVTKQYCDANGGGGRQVVVMETATGRGLLLSDENVLMVFSAATAITVWVSPDSNFVWPTGWRIDLAQIGAGQITVEPNTGVTIVRDPSLTLRAPGSMASLINIAPDQWILTGDLA